MRISKTGCLVHTNNTSNNNTSYSFFSPLVSFCPLVGPVGICCIGDRSEIAQVPVWIYRQPVVPQQPPEEQEEAQREQQEEEEALQELHSPVSAVRTLVTSQHLIYSVYTQICTGIRIFVLSTAANNIR